jgi:hypothetical protein
MPLMLRLWLLVMAVSVSGCFCGGGPAAGFCDGTWHGVPIKSQQLDIESRYAVVYPDTCGPSVDTYFLAWGAALQLAFIPARPPTLLSERDVTIPSDSDFILFAINPPLDAADTGTMHLWLDSLQLRHAGTLKLTNGTETLSCQFNVPTWTEGRNLCGGGGGDGD